MGPEGVPKHEAPRPRTPGARRAYIDGQVATTRSGALSHRSRGCCCTRILDTMMNDLMHSTTAAKSADRPATPAGASRPVVGRFAPSPSGRMHLGNAFSSLVSWLSARSQQGSIVMRIEDLDPRTQSGPWTQLVLDDLAWLGLYWDEGPFYQRERTDLYRTALETLQREAEVYPCFCTRAELHAASAPHASDGTPLYAGTCRDLPADEVRARSLARPPALRLRVPGATEARGSYSFVDEGFGPVRERLAEECGDFLVRRSDGVYAYQLAVVVDDGDMGVTEVVRGCDLLGSTARQMYLQDLLGYEHPRYGHVPLIVAEDGRRLSKRDRDLDMGELRARFGTPERLLGWLAHACGLAPDDAPRSAEQLADIFDWSLVRGRADRCPPAPPR